MNINNFKDIDNAIRNINSQLGVIANAITKEKVTFNEEEIEQERVADNEPEHAEEMKAQEQQEIKLS
jgi:ribosomal protein L12E/L44/L45/RPP1/RPP2